MSRVHHARLEVSFSMLRSELIEELPTDLFAAAILCTVKNKDLFSRGLVFDEIFCGWVDGRATVGMTRF